MNCGPSLSVFFLLLPLRLLRLLPFSTATVDSICVSSLIKRAMGESGWTGTLYGCHKLSLISLSLLVGFRRGAPRQGHNPSRRPTPQSEGGVGAHVAPDKPLWSISWMHSKSVEREPLKIKPCPWRASQWLRGQQCQRQSTTSRHPQ